MEDREKVIRDFESWIDDPYARSTEINPSLVHDALELLKEQKTVLHRQSHKELSSGSTTVTDAYLCPWCKEIISIGFADDDYRFCPYCGRGVKWDG